MADLDVLCVHAHPDDEALWTGGVLARYADSGARTGVVTCTWAEGTRRTGELERSLDILGAGKPRLLGYADAHVPDSAPGSPRFCDAPLDESVSLLVGHIREFRPDVVMTYDGYGLYGHPDHVHAHRVTLAAVEAAGYPQLYPGTGEPWRPRHLYLATIPTSAVRTVWQDLFGAFPDPGHTLPGVDDERIDATVDVGPWVDRKWSALLAHESETERGAGPAALATLPDETRRRLLATEWFIRHGADSGPQPDDLPR
jgi:LmbE family N-acetylglucosaminyl deacetylase